MVFSVPSLTRICVKTVVREVKKLCYGLQYEDLARFKYIVGPFENISSQCIEEIFEYVVSTKQLNSSWLSLLIVTHLRGINFKQSPSGVTPQLFRILINRCQLLERLIIPNCKKIPNKTLCTLLSRNPSLLELDISNKLSPKVDTSVVDTLARSCRFLTVLKLSDYRVSDPMTLLVLCGKKIVANKEQNGERMEEVQIQDLPADMCEVCRKRKVTVNGQSTEDDHSVAVQPMDIETLEDQLSSLRVPSLDCSVSLDTGSDSSLDYSDRRTEYAMVEGSVLSSSTSSQPTLDCRVRDETASSTGDQVCDRIVRLDTGVRADHSSMAHDKTHDVCQCNVSSNVERSQQVDGPTSEEQENQDLDAEMVAENSDEDLYEDDSVLAALNIEDCSSEYGCLDLETLWLDNVNVTDQVMAVLLQYLPRLRALNLCDTDICNPWRLLNPCSCTHLLELEELDIRSTALSRTALELIPEFHPDLHRFSISSTTLPPHTYANIGKLTGVADLELIGGQFYPCEPKEIFDKGIAPAICGIAEHLRLLNLTYFAHIEFEVIPKSCPKLEQLDLSFASVTFHYPCQSLGDCCPHLRILNLSTCHIEATEGRPDNLQPVSQSKALQNMIGQPKNLVELKLSGLSVGDDTLKSIFPEGAVHPLQVLDLSRCRVATINGVEHIWSKCPYLERIDLTYCREITVNDLNTFEKKCFEERPIFKLEGKLVWK